MTDDKRNWIKTVVMSVLIGFLSGIGVMAMTLNGDVREHGVLISRQAKDFETERSRTDTRIFESIALQRESISLARTMIEQASKLMVTIETQNRLITDQNRTIQSLIHK
jgi:hypothetical protein